MRKIIMAVAALAVGGWLLFSATSAGSQGTKPTGPPPGAFHHGLHPVMKPDGSLAKDSHGHVIYVNSENHPGPLGPPPSPPTTVGP